MTEQQKIQKGHCPECGAGRNADVVGHHHVSWDDDTYTVSGTYDYRILKCRGCETVYFQKSETFSEDVDYQHDPETNDWFPYNPIRSTYWPAPAKREQPSWSSKITAFDHDLGLLFDDIYIALDNDLSVLAAIGIRTVFDRASELLEISPERRFFEKLDDLVSQGKIGKEEKNILDILTDAGSAAAHRGWRPTPEELEMMMEVIENFLHRTFVLDKAVHKLKASYPPKPSRKKT